MRLTNLLMVAAALAAGTVLSAAAQPAADAPSPPPPARASADDFAALPVYPEVARLEAFLDDAAVFVEKARTFDRLHTRLADLLLARATALQKEGGPGEADALVEDARKNLAMARQAYELGLRRHPDNPSLQNYLGELLYDRFDEQQRAVELWLKAVAADAAHGRAHNNLGIHYFHAGAYGEGLKHLDAALALEPDNPDYLFNMAQMYLVHWPNIMTLRQWTAAETYAEAMRVSGKAAALAPGDFELVRDHALNFFAAERMNTKPDWKKAAKAWVAARKAARNQDEVFYTWMNEGRVWLRAQNGREAERCFLEAVALRPQSGLAQGLLTDARSLK